MTHTHAHTPMLERYYALTKELLKACTIINAVQIYKTITIQRKWIISNTRFMMDR